MAKREAELKAEIDRLEADLRPITPVAAAKAIAVMLKAYGLAAGGEDAALVRMYLRATNEMPAGMVEALCEAIAFGEVEGVSDEYPPKVPQFARLCRARAGALQATLNNRRRELAGLAAPATGPAPRLPPPADPPGPAPSPPPADELAVARARAARVAADLAGRSFPRSPSQVAAAAVEPPADVEAKEGDAA